MRFGQDNNLNKSVDEIRDKFINCAHIDTPYGNCMCHDIRIYKCEICGEVVSPYNTAPIIIRIHTTEGENAFHESCLETKPSIDIYKINAKVPVCLKCSDRLTPYSWNPYFCSTRCHEEFLGNVDREPQDA